MLLLKLFLLSLLVGSIVSIVSFARDVYRWHDKEEDTVVIPSADQTEEREVIEDASNVGEHNSSVVSFPWCESGLHSDTEV